MQSTAIAEALTCLEKANGDLQPELLSADAARDLLASYARAEKLASYGKTVLARKIDDPTEMARATGTSLGKATTTVATAQALERCDEVRDAFKAGAIFFDQAAEIATADNSRPGAAAELLDIADKESFQVL
jgi:hypothetical protein